MPFTLKALGAEHAAEAAAIHAEGQPGTFLTSLGPAFLTALYAEMASSLLCYGYVAITEPGEIVGVVVGTSDASAVFKQMIWRRGWRLVLPVGWAIIRHPRLLKQVWETLSYPGQTQGARDEAELFFIGTRASARQCGVGAALFVALADASRQRGLRSLGLVVDDANATAQRFYQRRGMRAERTMVLYGRRMHWYGMPLLTKGGE